MAAATNKRGSHIAKQARRADGRVASTYSTDQLYGLVRKAAFKARPDEPARLSVREFDRTIGSLGYPDAPSARAICARLKKGWPDIVAIAIAPKTKSTEKQKDAEKKSNEAKWLTERHLFFALNTIARFMNVKTMTAHDYDRYLAEYLADRKRPAHILGNARFPTSKQIDWFASTKLPKKGSLNPWNLALDLVGLETSSKKRTKALTMIEGINLYIDATGGEFYPARNEFPRLRKEFGVSIREKDPDRNWTEAVQAVLDERKKTGQPVPTQMARVADKVSLVLPDGAITPKALVAKGTWAEMSDQELAARLIPYVLDCQQRAEPVRPTKKDYQSWSVGRNDFPSANTLAGRKNWPDWMAMVDEMLLELKKAA